MTDTYSTKPILWLPSPIPARAHDDAIAVSPSVLRLHLPGKRFNPVSSHHHTETFTLELASQASSGSVFDPLPRIERP
jgi:hypothetical protein